ncbi:MAG: indolepyruvate oxidoreductase subunit beta [Desulfovibrionaceae bacterium]|jgi:indolepyruvate ferredoxin oxidoreductase beta subunit|nr:indolepyruvate oxidoreductase subunit beta [Desulfovibrionaceae bacterium]
MQQRTRIYLTGVGGQGSLTATTLLARAALGQGIEVTAGEIHGMAQRGGVVESFILLGGWKSPKLGLGEADLFLGFEPLETLRGLPYLKKGGVVVSSTEALPPVAVSLGVAEYPELDKVRTAAESVAARAFFLPSKTLGLQAGAVQSGNFALLGAACAVGVAPVSVDGLKAAVRAFLKPKLVDINLKAIDLGVAAVNNQ